MLPLCRRGPVCLPPSPRASPRPAPPQTKTPSPESRMHPAPHPAPLPNTPSSPAAGYLRPSRAELREAALGIQASGAQINGCGRAEAPPRVGGGLAADSGFGAQDPAAACPGLGDPARPPSRPGRAPAAPSLLGMHRDPLLLFYLQGEKNSVWYSSCLKRNDFLRSRSPD